MKKTPQVSIGMPVYNGERFIREAIDSLLAQTFTDFELIISDNASTDQTGTICQEYAKKDSRIRYVRQANNMGASANFKFVLDEAVGEYFMWAAADDLQKNTFIDSLHTTLIHDPTIILAMSDVENIQEDGTIITYSTLDDIRLKNVEKNWNSVRRRFFRNPTSNIFFCIYGLYRAEYVRKISLNYQGLIKYASGSEIPFLAQLSLLGKITSISEPLKIYRRHKSSVFHKEQSNSNYFSRANNMLNISLVLLLISKESKEDFKEKFLIFIEILKTITKGLLILSITTILKKIKIYQYIKNTYKLLSNIASNKS